MLAAAEVGGALPGGGGGGGGGGGPEAGSSHKPGTCRRPAARRCDLPSHTAIRTRMEDSPSSREYQQRHGSMEPLTD